MQQVESDSDDLRSGLADLAALVTSNPRPLAVHNAHALSEAIALTTRLQAALAARPVIDEAIGVIRSRTGLTSGQARERLQAMSQHEHTKMVDVARQLIDEAARRAHARHTDS